MHRCLKFGLIFGIAVANCCWSTQSPSAAKPSTEHRIDKRQTNRFRSSAPDQTQCVLPPATADNTYVVSCPTTDKTCAMRPAERVPKFTSITQRCTRGYAKYQDGRIRDMEFKSVCSNGSWIPEVVRCKKICNALPSHRLDFTCSQFRNGTPKPCSETLIEGDVVYPRCKPHYRLDPGLKNRDWSMVCQKDGTWDRELFTCSADCGKTNLSSINLIDRGQREKPGGAPWNVAIYSTLNSKTRNYLCGGTLISVQLVLSAAHCFYDEDFHKVYDERLYDVAVGLSSTNFKTIDLDSVKKYKVNKIYIPEEYVGSETNYAGDLAILKLADTVSLSEQILPACFDWSEFTPFEPPEGTVGIVSSFSATEKGRARSQLLTANLPYISYANCLKKMDRGLRNSLPTDMFCAGYDNGSGPRAGNGGDGFVFFDNGQKLYYVRGVVSHVVEFLPLTTALTDVAPYQSWIRKVYQKVDQSQLKSATSVSISQTSAPDQSQCIVPLATQERTYTISCPTNDKTCAMRPGERVPEFTSIIVQCNPGYTNYQNRQISDTGFKSICSNGSWIPEVLRCNNGGQIPKPPGQSVANVNSNTKFCTLPPTAPDKSYTIKCQAENQNCVAKYSGTVTEFTQIFLRCSKGYTRREGVEFSSICLDGSWFHGIVKCSKICDPLPSHGMDFTCSQSRKDTPKACSGTLVEGNVVYPRCKQYYHPDRGLDYSDRFMICQNDGSWDREFFTCTADCGKTNSSSINLIAYGHKEKPGEAPWNVAIYNSENSRNPSFICGGTLISAQLVLSAAHCFYDESVHKTNVESSFHVVVGQYSRDFENNNVNSVKKYKINKIYIPDEYIGSQTNYAGDLAILRLAEKIVLSEQILPACVYWSDYTPFKPPGGTFGKVSGFGATETGSLASQLITINLPYISYADCLKKLQWESKDAISRDKFCAGYNNGTGAKTGDSGGGFLFLNQKQNLYYLRGVVSHQIESIATFTDVTQYLPWVTMVVQDVNDSELKDATRLNFKSKK